MSEYISRDYAMKEMNAIVKHYQSPVETGLALCAMIIGAPVADVAPVVHGHWVKIENTRNVFKCSRCGHIRELRHISEIISKPKLCEECGAKMDESEETHENDAE